MFAVRCLTFFAGVLWKQTCMSSNFAYFLCPLNCATKFSGVPPSSKREMLVFQTEWLAIFFPQAWRPAFSAALSKNIPIWWWQLISAIWLLTPTFVIYGKEKRITWSLCLFWTMAFKKLKEADRASFCSRCEYFWVELSLVSTFHDFPGLAPSFCHPNQNFFACFWIILKLQIAPAQFPALVPGPETKVKEKEPPQYTLKFFGVVATKFAALK